VFGYKQLFLDRSKFFSSSCFAEMRAALSHARSLDTTSTASGLRHGTHADAQFARIELSVKCRNLKKMDWLSHTDSFCVLSIAEPTASNFAESTGRGKVSKLPSGRSTELGRTEVVRDTPNPDFCKTFQVSFVFEEQQLLTIRVFDEDKKGSTDLKKHAFIGAATLSLAELMTRPGRTLNVPLGKKSYAVIHAEEISSCNDEFIFQFAGSKLKNSDGVFGKSDPYYTISKLQEDGEYCQVFRSEVVKDNLFPEWTLRSLSLQKLCGGDMDRPLVIDIWDYDASNSHDKLGLVETTVRKLLSTDRFDVSCNAAKFGRFLIRRAEIKKVPSFLEYLSGSCRMRFMAAVDFTSSNGDPRSRDSLHFIDYRGFPNEYQAAIATVGSILENYCPDTKCFLFGYGMKESPASTPMHSFPVGNTSGLMGVDGMLNAYKDHIATTKFEMCEPTLLAPLVRSAASMALQRSESNEQEYSILLIISDGGISDLQQTIDEICVAAEAPLSIVIVGVGDGDFSSMEKLDSDDTVLRSSNGKECSRDIVQFVPFRKVSHSESRLAAETLAEIPAQLVQYFSSKGIAPTPPLAPAVDESDITDDCGSDTPASTRHEHFLRAEASPMIFVDSTPLVEATAVEVFDGASAIGAAVASQSSLPDPTASESFLPEIRADHHHIDPSRISRVVSSTASGALSSAATWVSHKQGRRHIIKTIHPISALHTRSIQNEEPNSSWVTKKQGK